MPPRMKAKTSPTGYVAVVESESYTIEMPVARFDEEGYALVCGPDGRLTRAAEMNGFHSVLSMWAMGR